MICYSNKFAFLPPEYENQTAYLKSYLCSSHPQLLLSTDLSQKKVNEKALSLSNIEW